VVPKAAYRALPIFGIAAHDAASGEPVETLTVGVIDITKVGTQGSTTAISAATAAAIAAA
jgi:hypothetical protein